MPAPVSKSTPLDRPIRLGTRRSPLAMAQASEARARLCAAHGWDESAVDLMPVIASGGVGTLEHLVEGVTRGHASAVLAASIFHFGEHTIAEAHAALRAAGLPARG